MIINQKLKLIFEKTKGHCHFCVDPVVFKKYGVKDINNISGAWEADHIIQKGKRYNSNVVPISEIQLIKET